MTIKMLSKWGLCVRRVKHFFQRRFRGWDDSETWSLYTFNARWLVPRLKRFKEITIGFPGDITFEEWQAEIDKMIYTFEMFATEAHMDCSKEEFAKIEEGLKLYHNRYLNLWW